MDMENTSTKIGIYCATPTATILFIAGLCMYKICEDAGQIQPSPIDPDTLIINQDCGGNDNISSVGFILMWLGAGCIITAWSLVCLILLCWGTCAAVTKCVEECSCV